MPSFWPDPQFTRIWTYDTKQNLADGVTIAVSLELSPHFRCYRVQRKRQTDELTAFNTHLKE